MAVSIENGNSMSFPILPQSTLHMQYTIRNEQCTMHNSQCTAQTCHLVAEGDAQNREGVDMEGEKKTRQIILDAHASFRH